LRRQLAAAVVTRSAAFLLPLAAASIYVGFRPSRRRGRVVIDALQMPAQFSGVGRITLELGSALRREPPPVPIEVRCPLDVLPVLERWFPAGTSFQTPLRSSRPRALRILYQQLVAPLVDSSTTALVCLGDQAPLWGRAKIVLLLHDVRRFTQGASGGWLERAFYRVVVPRSVRRADLLYTVSEFSRGEILERFGPHRPAQVLAAHPRPKAAAEEVRSVAEHLLVVGAVRPYKGADTVFEALALLDEQAPPVLWVGTDERSEVESASDAGRQPPDRLAFQGWVGESRLEELHRTALASISPSRYEGYGRSLAEGLAYGLPAIASDIPPHREIAADAALYFPPGDAASLAEAIRLVLEDSELRQELSRRACERSHVLARARPTYGDLVAAAAALVEPTTGGTGRMRLKFPA